jgi:predicted aspartyl protease
MARHRIDVRGFLRDGIIVSVAVSAPHPEATEVVRALVDTGATDSVISDGLRDRLGLMEIDRIATRGVHGTAEVSLVVALATLVDLRFLIPKDEFLVAPVVDFGQVADEPIHMLVGRDAIKGLKVILNGPSDGCSIECW